MLFVLLIFKVTVWFAFELDEIMNFSGHQHLYVLEPHLI